MKRSAAFYIAIAGTAIALGFLIFFVKGFIRAPSTLSLFLMMYGGFAFLGFLAYLLNAFLEIAPRKETKSNPDILLLLFLASLVGALLVLKSSDYVKPLSYYILVSFATASVGIQIIRNGRPHKILIQIVALALLIRSSSFLINPYLFGPDSYWHFNTVTDIIRSGHLTGSAGHYYYFPSRNILISFLEKIVVPSEVVYSITSLVLSLLAVPVMYILTRDILGERTGLMSSLLLTISTFHIFGSINYSPMINGFSLILVSFYILIKFSKLTKTSEYARTWMIFWLAALFVFFIHPVSSLSLGFILGANLLASHFIFKNGRKGVTPFYAYIIGFVAYLMFVHISLFREIVEVIFIPGESQALPSITFHSPTTKLLMESSLSYLGPTSLVFFGVYGGLKWIEKYNLKKMSILLSIAFMYSIPFFSLFRGAGGLDPGRMLSPIEVLIIMPAATSLVHLSAIIKNSKYRFALISSILIFLSFFSTFSYITWDGNQILKDEVEVPVGFVTQSTLAAHPFVEKLSTQKSLYMDDRTYLYINNAERGILTLNRKALGISYSELENEGYFVVNNLVLEMTMWGRERDKENFFKRLENGGKIYDNGNVQVFEK